MCLFIRVVFYEAKWILENLTAEKTGLLLLVTYVTICTSYVLVSANWSTVRYQVAHHWWHWYILPPVNNTEWQSKCNAFNDFKWLHMILHCTWSTCNTVHGKFLAGEKLVNLANCELFTKIFLANVHRYTENVFGIYTNCSLSAKFFLTNSFYLYSLPKVSPTKCFPCMVCVATS